MLALFKKTGIRASIFFSFGPDNSGKAIRRIFRPGFISKMMRTKAPSTYGLKTLMYGTLLPAPLIVPADPAIVRRALEGGHEVGVHAWDHVYVQDCLERISKEEYLSLYRKAEALYKDICGRKPTEIAAPGWQLSHAVLEAEQELGLAYASDVRGYSPFMPVFEGVEYGVPQIPTTLPTMDEIYGLPGINDVTIPKAWLDGMDKEWNVLTVHAVENDDGLYRRAVRVRDDPLVLRHRDVAGVDLRHDERHLRVHAPGGAVVDDDRAARRGDGGPLFGGLASRRKERDVNALERIFADRLHRYLFTVEDDLFARGARRGERYKLGDGEFTLFQRVEHFAPDEPRRSEHRHSPAAH